MKNDHMRIDEARKILSLGESATIAEIKDAYRSIALKYHPDKCSAEEKQASEEMFKKVNQANETLMIYCANYRFSFGENKIKDTNMDKEQYEHMKRFYDGWWGNID